MENSTPNDCIKTDVIPFIPPFSQRSSFQIINGFPIHIPSISKSQNDFGLISSAKTRNKLRKFLWFRYPKKRGTGKTLVMIPCTFLEVNTIPVWIPSGSEIHLTTCFVTFIIKLGSHQTEINSDLFRPEDNNEGSNPNSISGHVTTFLRITYDNYYKFWVRDILLKIDETVY